MKPRTKLQQVVFSLSKHLAPISETQRKWAYQHCFDHYGRRTKKGAAACFECGHEWTDKKLPLGSCVCPCCKSKIEIIETRKRNMGREEVYFCILTTKGGFQVIRYFDLYAVRRIGRSANYGCREVLQLWLSPDGKLTTIARLRQSFSWSSDNWNWSSELEIRQNYPKNDICPRFVYPRCIITPTLRRNGFRGDLHDISPLQLFHSLLTNNRSETLLKAGQYPMLRHESKSHVCLKAEYWPSVRICLRQGYLIPDGSMWCDYIDLLRFFGKDLTSVKYVCPEDLKAEHDRWERKKREKLANEEVQRIIELALAAEKEFQALKSRFFGIQFTDGDIIIRVLESVEEHLREGVLMHHCVFTNEYYLKPDSLIFSAQIAGEHIETVEVSLTTFQVLQSRGACNMPTEHHERIVNLMTKNVDLIRKRISA